MNVLVDSSAWIGIPDIIIAQNCIQNEIGIIARDRHFEAMAGYTTLKVCG